MKALLEPRIVVASSVIPAAFACAYINLA